MRTLRPIRSALSKIGGRFIFSALSMLLKETQRIDATSCRVKNIFFVNNDDKSSLDCEEEGKTLLTIKIPKLWFFVFFCLRQRLFGMVESNRSNKLF
jgi:hypothetical protein